LGRSVLGRHSADRLGRLKYRVNHHRRWWRSVGAFENLSLPLLQSRDAIAIWLDGLGSPIGYLQAPGIVGRSVLLWRTCPSDRYTGLSVLYVLYREVGVQLGRLQLGLSMGNRSEALRIVVKGPSLGCRQPFGVELLGKSSHSLFRALWLGNQVLNNFIGIHVWWWYSAIGYVDTLLYRPWVRVLDT
jgi:hypothetical protein